MIEKKFTAWYCGEKLDVFLSLKESQECIKNHPNYKKSYFTKRGEPSSKNPNNKERFKIYDNEGYGWNIH